METTPRLLYFVDLVDYVCKARTYYLTMAGLLRCVLLAPGDQTLRVFLEFAEGIFSSWIAPDVHEDRMHIHTPVT